MDNTKKEALQQIYNSATLSGGQPMDVIFRAMEMYGLEIEKQKNAELAEKDKSILRLVQTNEDVNQKHTAELASLQQELAESKKTKARTHNSEILDEFFYQSECRNLKAVLSEISAAVIEFVDADGSITCEKILKLAIDNTPEPAE